MLVLVVGPSGAGKDTILTEARTRLAGDPRFVFVQREITRPADAGGEIHIEVAPEAFRRRVAAGAYALSWQANGHSYGVPTAIVEALVQGKTVIVNASRTVVDQARQRFAPVLVVEITASPEELRRRLTTRGRETLAEIEDRLARSDRYPVDAANVATIANNGPVAQAVEAFLALLRGV